MSRNKLMATLIISRGRDGDTVPERFDVGFVVEQYCEENLSNKFLDHANALTKHFKVVVKDTSNDGHLESEGNNG